VMLDGLCVQLLSVTLYYILCVFLYLYGTHVSSFGNYVVTFLISMTALNFFLLRWWSSPSLRTLWLGTGLPYSGRPPSFMMRKCVHNMRDMYQHDKQ
jgi:hypothetical protein